MGNVKLRKLEWASLGSWHEQKSWGGLGPSQQLSTSHQILFARTFLLTRSRCSPLGDNQLSCCQSNIPPSNICCVYWWFRSSAKLRLSIGEFQQVHVNDLETVHSAPHYQPGCDVDSRGRSGCSHPLKGRLGTNSLSRVLGVDKVLNGGSIGCLDFSFWCRNFCL